MKPYRPAISLLGFCLATAMGAALAFACIVAGGAAALASPQDSGLQDSAEPQKNPPAAEAPAAPAPAPGTFSGMITDSYCGARHRKASHQNSTDCARSCVRKGARYVLVDGDHHYRLRGANDVLDHLVGQRANVIGTRQGGTIVVTAASPLSQP